MGEDDVAAKLRLAEQAAESVQARGSVFGSYDVANIGQFAELLSSQLAVLRKNGVYSVTPAEEYPLYARYQMIRTKNLYLSQIEYIFEKD